MKLNISEISTIMTALDMIYDSMKENQGLSEHFAPVAQSLRLEALGIKQKFALLATGDSFDENTEFEVVRVKPNA